ncbi:MAG: hypothetical protein A2546_05150 [Sphingobacteriia bacterium RIFOXYD2_FULL_35_12]|nr:MAG: hypothetical protein A2472_08995 [Sphingobacteriia bacterium RIFOXYC2_FULL_35_18]OHC87394.1 MAG: hypothetical protein A2546_05150 [Sphingobacteriia bacterium RIFOXYD2_FULL_35_12]
MIISNIIQQLNRLTKLLHQLSESQYTQKIIHLSNGTIGAHTRHIIELLQCTVNGYKINQVDYINRTRNLLLEKEPPLAIEAIAELIKNIHLEDKVLQMKTPFDANLISTTYYREIVYNEEHIIHHLALLKVALIELNLKLVEESFGIAHSTLLYKENINC